MARVSAGQSVHVLWAGGEVRTVTGETRLVDTGFMEGSIIEPSPIPSPPPYSIHTAELAGDAASTLRAKSLQGVIVRIEDVIIDDMSVRRRGRLRSFVFHDRSGGRLSGVLLPTVQRTLQAGQHFRALRGIVHQPRAAQYELIVELDEHMIE
jgi:hypothetical protein